MTIKRTELMNIDAKRLGPMSNNMKIRIDVNSNVSQIFLTEEDEARIDFRFMASYTGIGNISIEGRITFTGGAKELYENWTESGNMPEKSAQEIHGTIMNFSSKKNTTTY